MGVFLCLFLINQLIYTIINDILKNMQEKINVLVIPSDTSGCFKYRSGDPHVFLQKLYPDEFHVDINYKPNFGDLTLVKKYQIVHFHRNIGHDYNATPKIIKYLRSMGVVTVMDIDDYWLPGPEHPIQKIIVQHGINKKIIDNMREVDYVTTTTSLFASEISKHNKNVVVFPNAINPLEKQFNEPTPPSDKVRVGWLGGSSHLHDLELLRGFTSKLNKEHQEKVRMVVCGFDTRGTVTQINPNTNEETKRDILPHETVWSKYEQIFTNNYSTVTEDYKKFLLEFRESPYESDYELPYERVWTKPVSSYAMNYSKFDISLAPIKDHMFNRMKSQLKVIEAGFYKKALIASDVGPYQLDLEHCLKNGNFVKGNAILVPTQRNHSDWGKAIKKLITNPDMITELGERLYETVKDKYDLNNVTKDRAEWYKLITNK